MVADSHSQRPRSVREQGCKLGCEHAGDRGGIRSRDPEMLAEIRDMRKRDVFTIERFSDLEQRAV